MAKTVFYADEARGKILSGAKQLRDAVATTMGPRGRNVVIEKSYGGPTVTHDGVTVAEAINLPATKDNLGEKVGADLIKQAAKKLNKTQGDGTTTVTVLTYEILNAANKLIAAGYNPMELRHQIEDAGAEILQDLAKSAQKINNSGDKIAQVATVSAGDSELGKLIADVIARIGADGVITVEESQGLETASEITEGFTIDRGYVSAYMATDTTRMEAVLKDPAILITDRKVSNINEFLPVLEQLSSAGKKDLVLIAEEVEGEALGVLILNKLKGAFNTVAIKAPSYGDKRKDALADIAILTNATVVSADAGMNFDNISLDVLGSARKIIVGKDNTTIIEGAGNKAQIQARIDQISELAQNANSDFERDELNKRAASLGGKVAIIKVGGATETEIAEKKFRVDDAVAATKAALAGGIVAGGGVTPCTLARDFTKNHKDLSAGAGVLTDALKKPFLQLMDNAGLNSAALLDQVEKSANNVGVNVLTGKTEDLVKAGIVDPANVTHDAIETAVSIAATAITMGALVVDLPEPAKPAAPDMGGAY
ncbi:MAG: chaperonin GroEL [Candidatus Nanoperiomorbaceae bacterium]